MNDLVSVNKINTGKVRAIIFDLGDTLIHGSYTSEEEYEIWEEVYTKLILPLDGQQTHLSIPTSNDFSESIKKNVYEVIAINREKRGEKEIDYLPLFKKALEEVGLNYLTETSFLYKVMSLEIKLRYSRFYELGANTAITLKRLREHGYQLGMISNFCCVPDIAYSGLERFDLLKKFDETILSCEIGWSKPSPHIYLAICERMKIIPEKCLFVGDRLFEDIEGPQQVGMQAILTHEFRQEIPTKTNMIQPNAIISQLDQILNILESRNSVGDVDIPGSE